MVDESNDDFHKPALGQSMATCEYYIMMLKSIITAQGLFIQDLQRQAAKKPITYTWIDGVMQPERGVPNGPG